MTRAPWSALAAVGCGASGEKDMSLVRTTDMLYNAKVKPYGLRSGSRRCRKGWGVVKGYTKEPRGRGCKGCPAWHREKSETGLATQAHALEARL